MPVETYSEGDMPDEEFDTMVEDAGGTEMDIGAETETGEIIADEERVKRAKQKARARKMREFVGKAGKALEKAGSAGVKLLGGLFTAKPPEPDIYSAPQTAAPAPLPQQMAQPPRPGEGFFGSGGGGEIDKAGMFSTGGGEPMDKMGMFSGGGGGMSPLIMPQRQGQQFDLFTTQPTMMQRGGMMEEQQTAPELDLFGGSGGEMWGIGEGGSGESMLSSGEGNAEAMLFGGAQPRGRKHRGFSSESPRQQEGFDLFGGASPKAAKQGGGGFDLFGSATKGTTKRGKQPKSEGFDLFGGSAGKRQKGEGVTLF